MEHDDLSPADAEVETIEVSPLIHLIAPVAAIVGTMVVRKLVSSAYERTTGRPAPQTRDPHTPILQAILWTAVITTATAVAEVAIYRAIDRVGERKTA